MTKPSPLTSASSNSEAGFPNKTAFPGTTGPKEGFKNKANGP
jgi:hypothetical protein